MNERRETQPDTEDPRNGMYSVEKSFEQKGVNFRVGEMPQVQMESDNTGVVMSPDGTNASINGTALDQLIAQGFLRKL